jgi:hypothetical protein
MGKNISKEKIELIHWLKTLEDENLIAQIMCLKENHFKVMQDEITEPEKRSIEKGLADADKGVLSPHKEAWKIYEKWL